MKNLISITILLFLTFNLFGQGRGQTISYPSQIEITPQKRYVSTIADLIDTIFVEYGNNGIRNFLNDMTVPEEFEFDKNRLTIGNLFFIHNNNFYVLTYEPGMDKRIRELWLYGFNLKDKWFKAIDKPIAVHKLCYETYTESVLLHRMNMTENDNNENYSRLDINDDNVEMEVFVTEHKDIRYITKKYYMYITFTYDKNNMFNFKIK